MNVLCFYKKKKDWERTRLSEEITTLNVTVTQHRDLAPFLFCALFALRPYYPRPNVLFRYLFHYDVIYIKPQNMREEIKSCEIFVMAYEKVFE